MNRPVLNTPAPVASPAPAPRTTSATRWAIVFFASVFAVLAATEVILFVTSSVYTDAESARRERVRLSRDLPALVRTVSDASAGFSARYDRFAAAWIEVTAVELDSLDRQPSLPEPIRSVLADSSAPTAASCWDRLADSLHLYRDHRILHSRVLAIEQRVRSGDFAASDEEYLVQTLRSIQEHTSNLESHERCLGHLRDLIRVRSLQPAGAHPQGGPP